MPKSNPFHGHPKPQTIEQALNKIRAAKTGAREEAAIELTQPDPANADLAAELHPHTSDLLDRFAEALKKKLLASERKYGWTDDWMKSDWQGECQGALVEHVAKGDPLDVAAFAAFLWHHDWPTALRSQQSGDAEVIVDLEQEAWKQICEAAEQSNWIAADYYQNDWVSDVVHFLLHGKAVHAELLRECSSKLKDIVMGEGLHPDDAVELAHRIDLSLEGESR